MSGGGVQTSAIDQTRAQIIMNTDWFKQMQARQASQNPAMQAPKAPMPQVQSPPVGWFGEQQNDLAPMQMYQQAKQGGLGSLPASQPWQQSSAPFQQQPQRSFFGATSIAEPGQQRPGIGAK